MLSSPAAPPTFSALPQTQGFDASRCTVYGADVSQIESITGAGRACIAAHGLPDVVIANAGISVGFETAELADLDVMRRTFDTNNLGMAATFQPFVRAMCERRSGTLVGIASVAGIRGLPGHGAYCASKAAVIGYCESLRGECRPHGVKVVTIVPGYIATPLTQHNPYAMPFLMQPDDFADRTYRADRRGRELPRDPVADGACREAVARAAELPVRPGVRRAAAQASRHRKLTEQQKSGGKTTARFAKACCAQ